MICPRCKIGMKEQKRSFHKKRKWICPRCGKVIMQRVGKKKARQEKKPID